MSQEYSFVKYRLPAFVWSIAIFGLSAIPGISSLHIPLRADKFIHGAIYFILCLLVWRAFFYQSRCPFLRRWAIGAAFLYTIAYGILDEFHQVYVPGRTPDPMDVVADGTGALLCVFFLLGWRWRRKQAQKS